MSAAFLLMEATGLGGATLGLVLLPGLLSAGIGTLVFIGLDALTGYGLVSLGLPGLPMCVVMLALPMTSVLLATLLLFSDGLAVMPPVIVAVVVAHVSGPDYILGRNHPIRMVTAAPGAPDGGCACGRAINPGVGGALEVGRWRRKRSHI